MFYLGFDSIEKVPPFQFQIKALCKLQISRQAVNSDTIEYSPG